jgi:repressor LexA
LFLAFPEWIFVPFDSFLTDRILMPQRGRPVIKTLTDSQARVLRALESWIADRGGAPTVRELAEQVGMAAPSVNEQLRRLERNGYVRRQPFKSRSLTVLRSVEPLRESLSRLVPVPLVGTVVAGCPVFAPENICGEVLLDQTIIGAGQHFAVKAIGESMIDAGIEPGDILIVRQQQLAESRDIVVALVNDEATVKRLYYDSGSIELRPENSRFKPISIRPEDDLRILGKVIAIRRTAGK